MNAVPRVVVSAPSSGHGKTAVSIGLLAAYAARGLVTCGFKVGPDHVDAAYLGLAAGRPARNLDPRLVGPERIGPLFRHGAGGADVAVVEGTMGLYDGLTGRTDSESTAQVAGLLRAPVVLVVDAAVMGQSVAALVHGFRAYDEMTWLGGVILNRVASERHERLLREALADIGVPVFGALSRHDLGLAMAQLPAREHGVVPVVQRGLDATRAVRRLGELITAAVDLERLLVLARSAPALTTPVWSAAEAVAAEAPTGDVRAPGSLHRRPVVALAGGSGAGYGYLETAELVAAAGAEVARFDPLRDERLPAGTDALVIGGGVPESYAEELSSNGVLRAAVADLAGAGKPVVAEGTGLVWLCRELDGRPMCGVLDAVARTAELATVGYREAIARTTLLLPAGTKVTGHKLHRTQVTPRAGADPAWSWAGGQPEGFVWKRVHASYLGLHWAAVPEVAARLVDACTPADSSPGEAA
jgi:cobyrinic acid a,c-diamide synthase